MSGSSSGSAPMAVNKGSMLSQHKKEITSIKPNTSIRLCVPSMATSSVCEGEDGALSVDALLFIWRVPTLRAMTEDVPMLMPNAMLVSTITKER